VALSNKFNLGNGGKQGMDDLCLDGQTALAQAVGRWALFLAGAFMLMHLNPGFLRDFHL
jgi:hypothetical protein